MKIKNIETVRNDIYTAIEDAMRYTSTLTSRPDAAVTPRFEGSYEEDFTLTSGHVAHGKIDDGEVQPVALPKPLELNTVYGLHAYLVVDTDADACLYIDKGDHFALPLGGVVLAEDCRSKQSYTIAVGRLVEMARGKSVKFEREV